MREGPTFPLGNSPTKHRSKKMLALMVAHFQVLGAQDAASQRWQVDPPTPIPCISNSTRRGRSTRPSFSVPIPPRATPPPPVSACLLLTWSLCLPLPPGVCSDQPVCLSLSRLPTHRLVLSSAGYPAGPRSCCPPVPLLLSVCPRPAAVTAFNSLCPSPCDFSGLREGDKEVVGWGSL